MSKDSPHKMATIYDVADLAGVSHITVSRVVNNKPNVSAETRARVQKAMDELNYVPNPIAKTLQTRRSKVIELITTDIWGSTSESQSAISAVAQFYDFQLSILPTTLEDLYDILKATPTRMVAGTILYAEDVSLDYREVKQIVKNYPLVQMGGKLQAGLPSVTYDQYQATQMAIQHLIDLGHRQIAMIAGKQAMIDGQMRQDAFLATLDQHGLQPGAIVYGDFGAPSGEKAMQQLLALRQPFTALFAASDAMAVSAIHVMSRAGLRVPDDVSVIGYDDSIFSPYLSPPLTTIANNPGLLGRLTAEYLFELLQDPKAPRQQRVMLPEIVIRESTRALEA